MEDNIITKLSKTLFWDVELSSIDPQKHASYIIDRVMQQGTWEDFRAIKTHYGIDKIKDVVKKLRYLDVRVMHFCHHYFDIPFNDFRCYTNKPLNHTHWSY
jgi:hypothetical protein